MGTSNQDLALKFSSRGRGGIRPSHNNLDNSNSVKMTTSVKENEVSKNKIITCKGFI
jgi:hypothetical protein